MKRVTLKAAHEMLQEQIKHLEAAGHPNPDLAVRAAIINAQKTISEKQGKRS